MQEKIQSVKIRSVLTVFPGFVTTVQENTHLASVTTGALKRSSINADFTFMA